MKHKDYKAIHPGTFVTRSILNNLGSPDDQLKIIHIAGTNGKGSTAEFFTQILIAAGKEVGTFTSPAVYDFYDQFRIDGKPMPADVAEKYFDRAFKAAEGLNATDFEIQTAGVLLAFKEEGCEYAVIECGMGGLNDATNAVNKKQLAVITSISLEHTDYLGNTIEEICAQKAGIIKDCPVVINAFQPSDAAKSYLKNIGGYIANPVTVDGNIQTFNAATAIEGARILGLPEEAIRAGIKNTKPSGRVEEIKADGITYILDGAHNPAAFVPLQKYLQNLSTKDITIIFCCLADKDIDGNLKALSGLAEEVIAIPCQGPRARSVEETKNACLKYFKKVRTAQSVAQALDKANTKTVAVCGSFTILREAKNWMDNKI